MDKEQSEPYQRTRTDHANETAEDYCEAAAGFIADLGECRVGDLATHFAVSHVTVSRIVKRLQAEGLMDTEPFKPIHLTERGAMLAKQSRERHEVVFDFLIALGVDEKTAQIDSEGIEHHVSPQTLEAMKRFTKAKPPTQ
jgi:DtxR family manganese transport transcriptional regulator